MRDANLLRARRQFAGEIGGHGARASCGKAHIVDHTLPLSLRIQHLNVGRDGLQSGLRRGIHAVGGEIFHLAVHQQPERPAVVWLTQIERDCVRLGESRKLSQREIPKITMRQQIRQNIMAMLIPRCGRRTRRRGSPQP